MTALLVQYQAIIPPTLFYANSHLLLKPIPGCLNWNEDGIFGEKSISSPGKRTGGQSMYSWFPGILCFS